MKYFIAIALAALAGTASADPALPQTPEQWRAAAQRDIDAGYRATLADHAGAVDPHNPGFTKQLDAARSRGLALAAQVTDAGGYIASLSGFDAVLGDGHAGIYTLLPASAWPTLRWPGFVAAWRGDLYVYAGEPGEPQEGARIVSCDGKDARQLVLDNALAFAGRPDEEGIWWQYARNVFLDDGNPFVQTPRRCVFETGGKRTERTLAWRTRTETGRQWYRDSVAGPEALPVGLTEPRKKLFWVAMPTFKPDEQQRKDYRAIYKTVEEERQRFLDADAVVVDLRGNSGGNSQWSRDFAAALWGKEPWTRRSTASFAATRTWYRATPGNGAHFDKLVQKFTEQGEKDTAAWAARPAAGIRAALAKGAAYYVIEEDGQPAAPAQAMPEPAPFTRPVYVIVPGYCASACLDAIDTFKLFPNTILIGAPSSADSTYMEVRRENLPGGLAYALIPTKLYVNRPRGNGQFCRPDVPVNTIRWTTAEFLAVVERDLAARKLEK